MKRKTVALGILLSALTGMSAHAKVGFQSTIPSGVLDAKGSQPPRQEPPRQQPPRQQPPRQEPPRQQPPRQEPPRQEPPRHEPPRQHPPVVVPPRLPGQPGGPGNNHRMPLPPRPIPGGGMDPRRHGDDHANRPPQMPQQPWRDRDGRYIPPSRDHIGRIDRDDYRRNIHAIQDRWDRNDHDYHWHDWNGSRIGHHYDDFGYHWWGFYIGNSYFWTRYHEDRYWWYDPYWHRWVYMHDNRWWWQDGFGVVYVIIDNDYYRYGDNGGTVVVTPDPTPPVELPPSQPSAPTPDWSMFYSLDGTRSVQILGERKEAFLYDLMIADQTDRQARGLWLGAGVASAKFVYDDKTDADGTQNQVIRQIELSFDEAGKSAVADLNGEREVQVSGDARSAYLYNLKDDKIDPVFLADNETSVSLINEQYADASGEVKTRLKLVVVSAKNDAGIENTLMFDRNGAPYDASAEPPTDQPVPPGQAQLLQQKMQNAPTLRALRSSLGW